MYGFVDQPVTRLNMGSRFTLWAMRAWIHALGQGLCPPGALAPTFGRIGVLSALPDIHMAMALLNRDALDKLTFAPLNYPTIVEDEAVLLGLWRDATAADEGRVCATLDLLVTDDAVTPIASALIRGAPKLAAIALAPSGLDHSIGGMF